MHSSDVIAHAGGQGAPQRTHCGAEGGTIVFRSSLKLTLFCTLRGTDVLAWPPARSATRVCALPLTAPHMMQTLPAGSSAPSTAQQCTSCTNHVGNNQSAGVVDPGGGSQAHQHAGLRCWTCPAALLVALDSSMVLTQAAPTIRLALGTQATHACAARDRVLRSDCGHGALGCASCLYLWRGSCAVETLHASALQRRRQDWRGQMRAARISSRRAASPED